MAFDTVIDQIKAVRGETEVVIVKLGDVTGLSNGRAQVRIYGDSDASNKLYNYIVGYIPEVGDKVALLPQGKTYIILGKVTDQKPEEIYARKEWVEENYLPDDYKNVLEQGDGKTLTFTNNELVPKTNNKHNLGSSSKYFKELYIKKLVLDGEEFTKIYQDRIFVKNGNTTYSLIATESSGIITLTPSTNDSWILGTKNNHLKEAFLGLFRGSWKSGQTTERSLSWNSSNALVPDTNNEVDFGEAAHRIRAFYAQYWMYDSERYLRWFTPSGESHPSCIIPALPNTVSLGDSTRQFEKLYIKEIYLNGTLLDITGISIDKLTSVSGSYTRTLKLTATSAGATILPSVNNAFELGSSTYKLKSIYATTLYGDLDGAIKDGNQEIKFDASHNLNPSTTNYISLGTSNKQYKNVYGQNLYVNGSAVSSDRNLKDEIEPLEEKHVEFFKNLKPVSYKFKDGTSGRRHTGFIAQEVEEAIEEAGMTDKDMAAVVKDESQYYLRYEEIIAVQTKVIQDLMAKVERLEAKVNKLEVERSRT